MSEQDFLNELSRRYPGMVLVPASVSSDLKQERDVYKAALEKIAAETEYLEYARCLAQEALEEKKGSTSNG